MWYVAVTILERTSAAAVRRTYLFKISQMADGSSKPRAAKRGRLEYTDLSSQGGLAHQCPPFHYGSVAGFVLWYLMRAEPY